MLKAKVQTDGGGPNIQLRISRIDNGFLIKAGGSATYAATPDQVSEILQDVFKQFLASPEYAHYVESVK